MYTVKCKNCLLYTSVLDSMKDVGYLSEEDYESAVNAPFKIVQQESEGTDENYQSSYAIHCAALELMKKDNFQFQYVFKDKEDYTPVSYTHLLHIHILS